MTRSPILALLVFVSVSTMSQAPSRARSDMPDIPALEAMTARLAPIDLDVDISALPESEKAVLVRLIDAAKIVDAIFLRQRWAGSQPMLLDLARDQTPLGRARLKYFLVNKGPWSALDRDAVFIPWAPTKPPSSGFYPADATKAEVDAWFSTLSGDARAAATGFFTTIRRSPASEAYIAVRDATETQKLAKFAAELQKIEDSLPMDARYRNPRLGASAPIRVVNVLFSAGDGNHDVQTVAFNLPNDERIVTARGSKRVMLKNIQAAKFDVVLRPISRVVLSPTDQATVSFDAFFTHTVMHASWMVSDGSPIPSLMRSRYD